MPESCSGAFRLERDCETVLEADCAHFLGHFPGRPVLPAVGQLDLLAQALESTLGKGHVAEVSRLRLTLPLAPGDRLRIALGRPDGDGRLSFSILRGAETATAGSLVWRRA